MVRDARNRLRWGPEAPKYAERIWVRPSSCTSIRYGIARSRSGEVVPGEWDLQPSLPVESSPNVVACRQHWEHGVPWVQTGLFDYLLAIIDRKGHADGCRTLDELIARYERIDELFGTLEHDGYLRSRSELPEGSFRELGGVLVHVGRDRLIFGGGGHHRLAASLVLGFELIPAQVGVVHPEALPSWRSLLLAGEEVPVESRVGNERARRGRR